MSEGSIQVGIVVGSDSDLPVIQETVNMLDSLGVTHEVTVASAHRTPERTRAWLQGVTQRGAEVIIAGAGGAAHLPGVIAAETILPVIGVPMPTLYFGGEDSLYSIVQMPSGTPVAAMAVGKAGAANAGIFAAQILARKHEGVAEALRRFKTDLGSRVEKKAAKLEQLGIHKYVENM